MLIISFALTFFGEIESVIDMFNSLKSRSSCYDKTVKKIIKKTDTEVAIGNCYTTK